MTILRRIIPPTIEIQSIDDYIKIINDEKDKEEKKNNKSDFIFRGQDCDKPLKPLIRRLKPKGKLEKIEKLILDEFKRCSIPFLPSKHYTDWEWLSLAQHYGMPTRFLDWTYSALSALWFAIKDDSDSNSTEKYGVVYLFKPSLLDYKKVIAFKSPLKITMSVIYRPPLIDKRIIQQQGVFTAHLLNNNGIDDNFESDKSYILKLLKIRFIKKLSPIFRRQLNMLGYNSSSQFPDLSGLCKHLQFRFFWFNDEMNDDTKDR